MLWYDFTEFAHRELGKPWRPCYTDVEILNFIILQHTLGIAAVCRYPMNFFFCKGGCCNTNSAYHVL
jgi:hypothetical protein